MIQSCRIPGGAATARESAGWHRCGAMGDGQRPLAQVEGGGERRFAMGDAGRMDCERKVWGGAIVRRGGGAQSCAAGFSGGKGARTDHAHDLLNELALVEQAVALLGVLGEDGVVGALGAEVGGVVLLVLLARVVGAVGGLLGLFDGETEVGLTVEPGGEGGLRGRVASAGWKV